MSDADLGAQLARATRDGLAILGPEGELVDWNPAAHTITGWSREEAQALTLRALPEGICEIRPGTWVDLRSFAFERDGVPHTAILFSDSTAQMELREANRKLEDVGLVDPITHLPKRALALDFLARATSLAARDQRSTGVLCVGATTHDASGAAAVITDEVQRQMSGRLRLGVRASDLVAQAGRAEFIVILTLMRSPDDVQVVAARLLLALASPFLIEKRAFVLRWGIGGSRYPVDGSGAEELLGKARQAMERAQREGGVVVRGVRS